MIKTATMRDFGDSRPGFDRLTDRLSTKQPQYVTRPVIFSIKTLMFTGLFWWAGSESNTRHEDFQSSALPTELPAHRGGYCARFARSTNDHSYRYSAAHATRFLRSARPTGTGIRRGTGFSLWIPTPAEADATKADARDSRTSRRGLSARAARSATRRNPGLALPGLRRRADRSPALRSGW